MRRPWWWGFWLWGVILLVSGVLLLAPTAAPMAVLMGLAGAIPFWAGAYRAAEGTALRGAIVWAGVALGLGMLAQAIGCLESADLGRPWTGRLTYLMVLAVLAALVSVLGARNPGGGAWAILMVLLVVVFLIPWLELAGRVRRGPGPMQVRLDSPWTLFYGLLVLAGVTNYLPTRYGPAALVLGAGLVGEYLGLTRGGDWSPRNLAVLWAFVAWTLGLAGWLAAWRASSPARSTDPLERLWLWFRDHWGVVWALRTAERFNRTAELARWPARLSWFGVAPVAPPPSDVPEPLPEQAVDTLRNLVRRFATPARVESVLEAGAPDPCQDVDGPG